MSLAEAEVQELHLERPSSLGRDALDRFIHNKAAMVGVGSLCCSCWPQSSPH